MRSRRELAELLRLYDAEIRYTDHLVGQMCAYLKKRGWYDDCAVILSADHGEQYGEGQMILEHGTVHDSCIHIPMLLKLPGGAHRGEVCAHPVYGLDIAPAAARFFGVAAPEMWHGTALQDTLDGTAAPREYLVCEHGLYTCQRAVLQDGWKMVHTFSPGLWDFAEYALYHTEEDPRETADVKARYPEVLARMQALEAEWLERTLHGAPDPLARLGAENAQHGLRVVREVTRRLRVDKEQ